MPLNYTKMIADPVLGWIKLTDEEARFIDSCKFVQRLRHIRQLGFTYMVYPSAHHTRFEHSLGALQVVTLMFERLIGLDSIHEQLLDFSKYIGLDTEHELLLHVRIAALLHDLGHLPFSHVFEGVFGQEINHLISNCSWDSHEASLGRIFKGSFKEHELITYFILTNNSEFRKTIKEVMPNVDLRIIKALLHSNMINRLMLIPQYSEVVSQEDRDFLNLVGDYLGRLNILRSLISGDFDADRVEYILRDSQLTGARVGLSVGVGDIERIIDNMRVVIDDGKYVITFDEKAKANLEGFILARFNTYKLVYLHHKVVLFNTLARNLMGELLRHYDELNDEVREYLCKLYHFSTGLLRGYDIMEIIDDYLISLMLRNRQHLINRIRGISKCLDPLIMRSTDYKALWKRDFDFMELVNKHNVNLELINEVFPYLLSKGEVKDVVLEAFYGMLRSKLHEAKIPCLSKLGDVNEELNSVIIIGSRVFEPGAELVMMHGSKLIGINDVSPLIQSVSDSWKKSPHVFAFVDLTKIKENCPNSDTNMILNELRNIVIMAMNETLRNLRDIINKFLNNP